MENIEIEGFSPEPTPSITLSNALSVIADLIGGVGSRSVVTSSAFSSGGGHAQSISLMTSSIADTWMTRKEGARTFDNKNRMRRYCCDSKIYRLS